VITALFDHADEVRGFAKITRDDTARRAADVQARQLDVCVDHDRIARGLNDNVISRIFGVGLTLVNLRSFSQDPRHNEHIDHAVNELDRAINDLRDIVLNL
jgi:signal transduction histidine kinase